MNKFLDIAVSIGIVVVTWGVWRQNFEEMAFGLASIIVGLAYDFAHDRRLTGAGILTRWRPAAGKLRLAAYVLAVLAALTVFGLWRGIIPAPLVVIMLGLVVAAPILAAPFLYFHRRLPVSAKRAEAWPQVMGRVDNAFITEAGEWPAPIVIYSYEVDGRRYRSSRVRFGGTGGMSPAAVDRIMASYATGSEVPIFYDPARPRQSVLLREPAGADQRLLWGAGCIAAPPLLGALLLALLNVVGLIDAALTTIVGHRVLP